MFKKIITALFIGAFVFSLADIGIVPAAASLNNAAKARGKTTAQIIKAQNKADAYGAKLNLKKYKKSSAKKKTVKKSAVKKASVKAKANAKTSASTSTTK